MFLSGGPGSLAWEVEVRILVVEDSARMANLLTRGLEEEGYSVDAVASGEDAVQYARSAPYDVILLDVMLPRADGFEVCRHLRVEGNRTPVLMLTARDAVMDRVAGLDAGADDYLTKPFSFQELFARVRALIRRGPSDVPAVLEVGDLSLDPARHEVRRGKREVRLTAKEFALLEYLMRNAGQVLSRRQLIEHAWDFAYEGDSNVLDVYVRYLREKIDRPFGRTSIETVRGVGYKLRHERAAQASH
jgi:two-component system OmpR family response regulator